MTADRAASFHGRPVPTRLVLLFGMFLFVAAMHSAVSPSGSVTTNAAALAAGSALPVTALVAPDASTVPAGVSIVAAGVSLLSESGLPHGMLHGATMVCLLVLTGLAMAVFRKWLGTSSAAPSAWRRSISLLVVLRPPPLHRPFASILRI